MIILDKITKILSTIYNIPSIIVLMFVLVIKFIRDYKACGNIDEILQKKYYIYDAVEDFRPIGKHINYAFWILITYMVFF